MAKLPQPTGGTGLQISDLAPAGPAIAVCVRIVDLFGVMRPTFDNPQIEEKCDVTRFIFGMIGLDGKPYLIQTFEFTISGAPGANLMKFLKSWLGNDAPIGWDYSEQLGKGIMFTVQHKESTKKRGTWYANIVAQSPVHPQLLNQVPNRAIFEPIILALERGAAQSNQQHQAPPTPPGPTTNYPPVQSTAALPPPPPSQVARKIYVHVNGTPTLMDLNALAHLNSTGQGALPAIYEGDTAWSTVAALAPKAPSLPAAPAFPPPPVPPPVVGASNAGSDDSVPF